MQVKGIKRTAREEHWKNASKWRKDCLRRTRVRMTRMAVTRMKAAKLKMTRVKVTWIKMKGMRNVRTTKMVVTRMKVSNLIHSVPWNEAFVPCGYARAAHGTRTSFCKLYFCCLGKHSQTETGFKTDFIQMKGVSSIPSYCVVLTFKSAKIWWLVKEIFVFWSIGYIRFTHDDSEHEVDDSEDGWVLDSE